MARTDLTPAELAEYRPEVAEPADFDDFWGRTLAEAREHDLDLRLSPVRTPYRTVEVQDVTFAGFGGDPISAWLLRPVGVPAPQVVVEFLGYGGGRDLPGSTLHWASAGYTHLLMDTRGQGSVWGGGGSTPDPHGSGPSAPTGVSGVRAMATPSSVEPNPSWTRQPNLRAKRSTSLGTPSLP